MINADIDPAEVLSNVVHPIGDRLAELGVDEVVHQDFFWSPLRLHLAASTSEAEVELAIKLLLEAGRTPTFDAVRELTGTTKPAPAPAIAKTTIDLSDYDTLLTSRGQHG
jgi:hypothetical protein